MSKDSLEYLLVPLFLCANAAVQVRAQQDLSSGKKATKEAINLYNNVKRLTAKGFMFGQPIKLLFKKTSLKKKYINNCLTSSNR